MSGEEYSARELRLIEERDTALTRAEAAEADLATLRKTLYAIGRNSGWLLDYIADHPNAVRILRALVDRRWDDEALKHLLAIVERVP